MTYIKRFRFSETSWPWIFVLKYYSWWKYLPEASLLPDCPLTSPTEMSTLPEQIWDQCMFRDNRKGKGLWCFLWAGGPSTQGPEHLLGHGGSGVGGWGREESVPLGPWGNKTCGEWVSSVFCSAYSSYEVVSPFTLRFAYLKISIVLEEENMCELNHSQDKILLTN